MQMAVMICTVGVMYGTIRADLKSMHERLVGAEDDIEAANRRMDNHIDRSY